MPFSASSSVFSKIGLIVIGALIAGLAVFFLSQSNRQDPSPQGPGVQSADTAPSAEPAGPQAPLPAFDLVRISRGGTGVIAGRMAPGAIVELTANGTTIADVVADTNGDWVILLEEPLDAGAVELNLQGRLPGDETLYEAEEVVVVSVPARAKTQFVERQEDAVVAIASPKSGDGASRILQRPSQTPFSDAAGALAVDTVDYDAEAGRGVVTGRGLARTQVRLYFDDAFQGAVKVSDDGAWQIDLTAKVDPGEHILRLDQTLNDGEVQLRIEQPFALDTPIDPSTATAGVLVKPGNSLWQIARRVYGRGTRYTLIFRENSEQIREPDLIYPGQLFRLPARQPAGG